MRRDVRKFGCVRCGLEYVLEFNQKSPGLCEECLAAFRRTRAAAAKTVEYYAAIYEERYDLTDRRMRALVRKGKSLRDLRLEMDILHRYALDVERARATFPEIAAETRQKLQTWYDKWPQLETWR